MRLATLFTLLVLVAAIGPAAGQKGKQPPAIDLKGKTLKQAFAELLPELTKQGPQQQWQNLCFQLSAPGHEAQRSEACKLMAEKLGPDTPNAVRIWLLKQLERIGREECLDAVDTVLIKDKDDQVRDAAVRCLAHNPTPTPTSYLVSRLADANGKAKVGLLNALAYRAETWPEDRIMRAVTTWFVFAKELTNADQAVATAAARVLGKIGTPEVAKVLAAVRGETKGEIRLAISDAWLLCADRRLKEGKTAEAAAIYKELNKAEEPRPIRLAALQGVLKTAGDQAGPMILEILGGTDRDAQAIAVGQIEGQSALALKPLAASLAKLPPASQVLVLNAIAARGDKSQLPAALAASRSSDARVKQAGIGALGRLGDAAVVPQLLELLFAGGSFAGPASDSLGQLTADGVNQKLIAALEAEKNAGRVVALIGVLERRNAVAAVPALLTAARSADAAVRAGAFAGLKSLAAPKHAPEMVLALLKTEKGLERDQAEQAVTAVLAQLPDPDKRAEPVLALLNDGARGHQAALLPLLGRLGGPEALKLLKQALAGSNPELYEAGVVGLCNWPDTSASGELLKLAQGAKESAQRLLALHAVIRVNTVPQTDRTNEQKLASLAALKKAMELTTRDQERKAILDRIGFVRHIDTLRYVVPYLDHKELNQQACRAVVEVAHSRPVRDANKAECDKALDRVIAICKDKGLVDRARQYKLQ